MAQELKMSKEQYAAVHILRCAVLKTEPEPEYLKGCDPGKILAFFRDHKLTAFVAPVIQNCENDSIFSEYIKEKFRSEKLNAIRINLLLDAERKKIFSLFEENNIEYLPMKGCILKDLYYEYGTRQMGDIDVLVKNEKASACKEIMEKEGYIPESFGEIYHDEYNKPPFYTFEIHRALLNTKDKARVSYYADIWDRLMPVSEGSLEYRFSASDFYIFHIMHALIHFESHGTGLRSITDEFFLLKNGDLDFDYISHELGSLGAAEFEKKLRSLTIRLFDPQNDEAGLSDEERYLLEFIVASGAYGNASTTVISRLGINSDSGKLTGFEKTKYMLSRIFTIPNLYRRRFPILYKLFITRPIILAIRLFDAVTKSRSRVNAELDALSRM